MDMEWFSGKIIMESQEGGKEGENHSDLDMIIHSFVHWVNQALLSACREWDTMAVEMCKTSWVCS